MLGISAAILAAEVAGAVLSGSLALLADAGHGLSDVAGLGLALTATVLAARPVSDTRTWGYLRAEVLAAAAQAAVLLVVGGFVLAEAVRRLISPPAVTPDVMVVFGAIALAGNAVSVVVLSRLQGGNLNTRAALLEVANDALGSAAVLVGAIVIALAGWTRADPVASLLIAALIVPRTVTLLREALRVLMEATPGDVDLAEVRAHILAVEHVHAVHDVHATAVASNLPVLTAHVVVDDSCFAGQALRRRAQHLPVRAGRPRRPRACDPPVTQDAAMSDYQPGSQQAPAASASPSGRSSLAPARPAGHDMAWHARARTARLLAWASLAWMAAEGAAGLIAGAGPGRCR